MSHPARRAPWLVEAGRRLPDPARDLVKRVRSRAEVGVRSPVRWGSFRRTTPVNDHYGYGRGTPIDRWYLQQFMSANRDAFVGRILELQNDEWSGRFADSSEASVTILDIDPTNVLATYIADLDTPGSVEPATFECVVAPQTLQYLHDPVSALRTLAAACVAGGVLLLTVPTVSRLDETCGPDGDLRRLTPAGLERLLDEALPGAGRAVVGFGNVLTSMAFLMGIAAEELDDSELAAHDSRYPMLACARVTL